MDRYEKTVPTPRTTGGCGAERRAMVLVASASPASEALVDPVLVADRLAGAGVRALSLVPRRVRPRAARHDAGAAPGPGHHPQEMSP